MFVAAGWAAGAIQWNIFLAFFSFMLLSQVFTSLLAILTFTEEQKLFRLRYIMYLVMLAFVEFFWYRWIISIAKLVGTFRFLRRIKSYDQYKRSKHV